MSDKEQRELNRLDEKVAGGQELSESQKKRRKELGEKDPERKRQQAEKEREKKEQELKAAEQAKEQKRETMYSNIQFIRDNMEEALGKVK